MSMIMDATWLRSTAAGGFPNDYFSFKRLWLVVVVLPGTQHVLDINMATGINKNRK